MSLFVCLDDSWSDVAKCDTGELVKQQEPCGQSRNSCSPSKVKQVSFTGSSCNTQATTSGIDMLRPHKRVGNWCCTGRGSLKKPLVPRLLTQEEPPDIPAWNIERATQRLSEDESFGNTRRTLTRQSLNISQVYRECSQHGTSTKQLNNDPWMYYIV